MGRARATDRPRRRRGCCGTGCTLVLILLLLLVGGGAALYFQVPQKLGLIKPAAERLLAPDPDREAAATLLAELQAGGLNTTGMELYVMPYRDGSGSVAYAVLDGSAGFHLPTSSSDPVLEMFKRLASGEAAQRYGLERVAIEYRGSDGEKVMTMTATTAAIQAFANGKLTRQEMLKAIDGNVNPAAIAAEVAQ